MVNKKKRGDCPKCGGKNTYTEWMDGATLKYNCYRQSCTHRGRKRMRELTKDDINSMVSNANAASNTEFIPPLHWTLWDSNDNCTELLETYDTAGAIDAYNIPCWYDPKMHRLVLGLQWEDKLYGAIGRKLTGGVGPKWYVYKRMSDAMFCAPCVQHSDTLLLIEDAFSALRAAPYVNAKALLSTSINASMISMLGTKWKRVIVALDPDAAKKNLSIQHRLQAYYDNVRIEPIKKDIKYFSDYELAELLHGN